MAQFYFLSVLLNIIAGLILIYGKNLAQLKLSGAEEENNNSSEQNMSVSGGLNFDSPVFRLVVGILCIFVAIMKILSVFRNDVPVIGDLLPVIAGFISGCSILLEYYIYNSSEETSLSDRIQSVFIDSRKYIGIGCIVIGVLHFIFPQVVLL